MVTKSLSARGVLATGSVAVVLVLLAVAPQVSFAKTPDGVPPSQESVCSGLQGAAFGLCNAYCEAQDCDVHPRPSCAQLRRNFLRITGSPTFPCDTLCGDGILNQRTEQCDPPGSPCPNGLPCARDCTCPEPSCGDGIVNQNSEQCDPPGSPCPDERQCAMDCTCPEPFCGDGILDPGEQCDPAASASFCPAGCAADCTCIPTERCCECVDPQVFCADNTNPQLCMAFGCQVGAAGTVCDTATAHCAPPQVSFCCACDLQACFDANSADECLTAGCQPSSPGFTCNPDSGGCVGFGPAP